MMAAESAHTREKNSSKVVSPARREAFAILLVLEKDNANAHSDDLLRGARVSTLSPQDRHLCTTLAMGTLRWQIRLDSLIKPLLNKPNTRLDAEVRVALRLGALQLLFLDRIPAHAAIGESVALAKAAGHKFASGMVNAVLRKVAALPKPEQTLPPTLTAKELTGASAHPVWLVERWIANYGVESARAICQNGQRQPELTIRLEDHEAEIVAKGIETAPGAMLIGARRVLSGDVTATEAFRSGRVRIQEEGSQLIAELAGRGARILDCCAAPGGKTMILAERNPEARVTACDVSPARAEALRSRIAATPYAARIDVRRSDAAEFDGTETYDLVLADVPCSGTGTLGRNPEIRHRLEVADLARHHARQVAILRGALRAGSRRVVYSTCSLEPEENAAVVAEVLAGAPEWCPVSALAVLDVLLQEGRLTTQAAGSLRDAVAADGSLTILPGSLGPEIQTDGFFIAILEKAA